MPRTITTLLAMATLSAAAPLMAQTAYSAGPNNAVTTTESDSGYTQPAAPIERTASNNVYATPNGAYATLNSDPQNEPQPAASGAAYQGSQPRNTTSTPAVGVWLVTAPDSSVKTVTATPGQVELRVERGRANINVHHPADHSLILVDLPGGQVSLLKDGLYTFNAESNTVRVLHGEAETTTAENTKGIKIKEDHQLVLGASGKEAKAVDAYPEELRADLLQGNYGGEGYRHGDGYYGEGFYGGYPYAYGWPYYGFYGPGWGYPYYAFGGYPYGYGFGLGFGYYGGYRGGFGGYRGGYGGYRGGGFGGGRGFGGRR